MAVFSDQILGMKIAVADPTMIQYMGKKTYMIGQPYIVWYSIP
jgi:hypothetical protein